MANPAARPEELRISPSPAGDVPIIACMELEDAVSRAWTRYARGKAAYVGHNARKALLERLEADMRAAFLEARESGLDR